MIQEFGIDKELDEGKLDDYFKTLEDHIYNNLKNNLIKDKGYMKEYEGLVGDLEKMKQGHFD